VISALHATAHPGSWIECRSDVHRAFREESSESAITVLPRVLSKIPVLIFAGDQDLICNYIGLENMIKGLTWNGATGLGVSSSFFNVTESWLTGDTSDGSNTIMDSPISTCWDVGNVEEFDVRQGKFYLHCSE